MPSIVPCVMMLLGCVPAIAQDYEHQRPLYYLAKDGEERGVKTVEDWRIRRAAILAGMEAAMGELPSREDLPAFDVKLGEKIEGEGYVRVTISFLAAEGERVPAYLYLPVSVPPGADGGRKPAMLALHPTNPLGKGVVDGQSELPNRAYAKELAQRGYVVIAPDYPSFGDSKDYDFSIDRYESGTMKGVFNHMRCVDYLRSRDEVDPDRIGVIGHSLGGHNAMFVGAFDERLKVIVTSCGWTPFHDYYGGKKLENWAQERYMPLLRERYGADPDRVPFDFYEVAAALAPRAFFTSSPLRDHNFEVKGVKKAMSVVGEVYRLHGVPAKAVAVYPDAEHDFPREEREAAYKFIDAALKGEEVR